AEARERIAACAELNAFISVTEEDGEGPVVAVKDLVDVRGVPTTGGGAILPLVRAERDALVIRRLREHGCVMIGKTNLHEWAFGVTSQNPHHGGVRNPRALDRVPGGSSGGSGAAVAAGLCDWAIGSDTGGSIRIPASFCGVVGIKPTIGSVDTEGVIPLSRTLDTLGPLAPDVSTAARALEMLSGLPDLLPERVRPLSELRVGAAAGWGDGLEPELAAPWERVAGGLSEVQLPERRRMGEAGLTILLAEAAAFHRHSLELYPDRFGDDVRRLLEQGLEIDRHAYSMALLEQSRIRAETETAMEGWDAVLAPTTRVLPPKLGEAYERADLTGYTRPFNTTGQPVVTLPAPVPADAVPVGISVVGHFGQDAAVIEVALALEAAWRE
ncbi:MAG TPA: amidase, partial [Candidatus Dormibacteraeota bacterium]|nr:amidase [Candidatus Dormibacteraeota bacterium]